MPTKRRKNIPGKTPQPSRNSHRNKGKKARSPFNFSKKQFTTKGGFSTSRSGSFFGHKATRKTKTNPNYQPNPLNVAPHVPEPTINPKMLFTRRNLLIGAAAIGGIAAVGGGLSLASDLIDSSSSDAISYISVPSDSVEDQSSYTLLDSFEDYVQISAEYSLDYGTLVWADNDTYAACLIPTEEASPLSTVALLSLSSGNMTTIFDSAQGADDGYEILDVRCSEEGLVWTESNAYESTWRVYTATLSNGSASNIQQVEEGDSNWLMPSLAAIGSYAFWQLEPSSSGDYSDSESTLKAAAFGSEDVTKVYTSSQSFATRVTAATDGVVIAPRSTASSSYYTLTKISAESLEVTDQMTLPSSMTPDAIGYGRSGFSFCFTSIYSYGDGIANLGTYTPRSEVNPYNYDDLPWFRFSRSPITAPCWCGDWFIVKSTTALSGVHFSSKSYFVIDLESGTDTFGEHLVSSGTCSSFIGLTNIIDSSDTDNDYTLIKVYTPISDAIEDAFSS